LASGHLCTAQFFIDSVNLQPRYEREIQLGYVYLIRNGDLFKIGRTDNLQRRLKQLQPCTVIQTLETDRSRDLEYELHQQYKSKRIPQTEYFRLTESQVEDVAVALGKTRQPGVSSGERQGSGSSSSSSSGSYHTYFDSMWKDPAFREEMERRYWNSQSPSLDGSKRSVTGVHRNAHQDDGIKIRRTSSKEHNDPLSRFTTSQKSEYWELFHKYGKRYADKVFAQKYPTETVKPSHTNEKAVWERWVKEEEEAKAQKELQKQEQEQAKRGLWYWLGF